MHTLCSRGSLWSAATPAQFCQAEGFCSLQGNAAPDSIRQRGCCSFQPRCGQTPGKQTFLSGAVTGWGRVAGDHSIRQSPALI